MFLDYYQLFFFFFHPRPPAQFCEKQASHRDQGSEKNRNSLAGQEGAEANGKGLCPFLFLLSPVPCKALSCCSPITQAGIARRGSFRATDSGAVAFGSEATSSGFFSRVVYRHRVREMLLHRSGDRGPLAQSRRLPLIPDQRLLIALGKENWKGLGVQRR